MYINNSNVSMSSSGYKSINQKSKVISITQNSIQSEESSYSNIVSRNSSSINLFNDTFKFQLKDSLSESITSSLTNSDSVNDFSNKYSFINSDSNISNRISDYNSYNSFRINSLLYLLRFLYNKLWKNTDEKFELLNSSQNIESINDSSNNVIGTRQVNFEYNEKEEMNFSTAGSVITSDGRTIDFNLDMTLSREFSNSYFSEEDILAMNNVSYTDPLIINFDIPDSIVTDQKFYFDIDSDGLLDSISSLDSSSGFLALDINGDNIINDGSELFGTKSGNGFYDLSKYDTDNNGWIDENDDIFSKLLIWSKDESGNDIIYHLKDKGIGAICLQNVNSEFSLKNSLNVSNAIIKTSGLFLYEDGTAGSVQQIDLAT